MKILYLLPSLKNAGPVNVCLNLIKELPSNVDVTILSINDGELFYEFNKIAKVHIFKRTDVKGLIKFSRENNFDIIHSHCTIPDIYSFIFFHSAIKFTTIHNYLDVDFIYGKGFFLGKLEGIIGRFIIKKFVKVACSKSVMSFCTNEYKMERVKCVCNGVSEPQNVIKNINKDTYDFYYLGSLIQRKNVEVVLRSFTKWNQYDNVNLHIIGSGNEHDILLKKYIDKRIHFHGKIKNPSQLIRNYDCFISASKAEGLPLALIESISLGNTFICSDIEPHREVYDNLERGGCLFDGTDDDLIVKMASQYSSTEKEKVSACCIAGFKSNYTSKLMADNYMRLYVDALSNMS